MSSTVTTPVAGQPSFIERWWRDIDRGLLKAILLLVAFGVVMVMSTSPSVSVRITGDIDQDWMLAQRHFIIMPLAILGMLSVSFLPAIWVKRLGILALVGVYGLLVITLVAGMEVKGARRWIRLPGFSLQAAEFLKPMLAITCAWLFACWRQQRNRWLWLAPTFLYVAAITLLMLQPDFGQSMVTTAIWFTQFFVAGLPLWFLIILIPTIILGAVGAYLTLPHVASRVNRFLDPSSGDTYQIDRSLQAFANGGLTGQGPGEGKVKYNLPDAHADFVFPVLAEEFGFIGALILLIIMLYIFYRAIRHAFHKDDLFVLLALTGLITQFMAQSFIHIGSSLNLIPAKGMTLPFISYGGSSLLGWAIGFGAILAFTRKKDIIR